ncbi:DUF1963 domain-containing protein [Streptomyces sp. enrichment culture]|uniref:DUF1963 domain-containing protein n=1 Tax=Streptomyces sp. enrichment culture TaxID=1795815 RepID=UPI003F56B42B
MFEEKLAAAAELFRPRAAACGIPPHEVEAFIARIRPAAHLEVGDGPLCVGRVGGVPMLPHDAPDPSLPFIFSIDCAALPAGATDLPMPPDGHLLFFAAVGVGGEMGDASTCYVPAGTPTGPRPSPEPSTMDTPYPERPLRVAEYGFSTSDGIDITEEAEEEAEEEEDVVDDAEDPLVVAGVLGDEWGRVTEPESRVYTPIQLGGWHDSDLPWMLENEEGDDWVDLASWICLEEEALEPVEDSATFIWAIRRQDLAALRFDRVFGFQGQ